MHHTHRIHISQSRRGAPPPRRDFDWLKTILGMRYRGMMIPPMPGKEVRRKRRACPTAPRYQPTARRARARPPPIRPPAHPPIRPPIRPPARAPARAQVGKQHDGVFVEKRMKGLAQFLRLIAANEFLNGDVSFRKFLSTSDRKAWDKERQVAIRSPCTPPAPPHHHHHQPHSRRDRSAERASSTLRGCSRLCAAAQLLRASARHRAVRRLTASPLLGARRDSRPRRTHVPPRPPPVPRGDPRGLPGGYGRGAGDAR